MMEDTPDPLVQNDAASDVAGQEVVDESLEVEVSQENIITPDQPAVVPDDDWVQQDSASDIDVSLFTVTPYRFSHTITGFVGPFGLAIAQGDKLVVGEWRGHSITITDKDGRNRKTFGRRPATEKSLALRRLSGVSTQEDQYRYGSAPGQLYGPTGVAVTLDGSAIVVDSENHRLQLFSMEGSLTAIIGLGESLQYPYDVAVDGEGQVFVSDTFHHCIQVYSTSLSHSHTIGRRGAGKGEFSHPLGIAIEPSSGTMYVCDRDNSRVQKLIASTGEYVGEYKCDWLQYPAKVAVDVTTNTLFVSYGYSSVVAMYSITTGHYTGCLGVEDKRKLFQRPRGMAISNGQLMVCDSIQEEVIVFIKAQDA